MSSSRRTLINLPANVIDQLGNEATEFSDLPPEPVVTASDSKACRLCDVVFETLRDQREHAKSAQHIAAVQDSRNDTSSTDESESAEDADSLAARRQPMVFFGSGDQRFGVFKAAFVDNDDNVPLPKQFQTFYHAISNMQWAFLALSGGRFVGMIVNVATDEMIEHKTFQRYTVRRKQGGSQRGKDASGNKPKSAGANIRRQNEVMLDNEVRALLNVWRNKLQACQRVFIYAPGPYNKQTLFRESSPLKSSDPRLKSIPFPIGRLTLEAITHVYHRLNSVY
jgi:hypothetical protein